MADVDSAVPSPVDVRPSPPIQNVKVDVRPESPTTALPSSPSLNKRPEYIQRSTGSSRVLVRRIKRKDEGTWKPLARWLVEYQIGLSLNLIALLFLAHLFIPKSRVHTRKFFQLSYYNPRTGQYGIGHDDGLLVTFCVIVFTGLRAAVMEYALAPLAKSQGIQKKKLQNRFCEQAWLVTYYIFFWTLGVYIWSQSPHWMNLKGLWTEWPAREMTGLMKSYMLVQWAFWMQQILVLFIEDRRKDHWQMFSHHIITNALVSACYFYHHTRVGNLILVIMDVVELFFPTAKCLKYAGYNKLCDVMFGLFMVVWIAARHVAYMMVCWSIFSQSTEIISPPCYKGSADNLSGPYDTPSGMSYLVEPFLNPSGQVCYNNTVMWLFLGTLLMLQAITVLWFTMIVRVAIKVIRGDGAEDSRSDDEDDMDEEEEEEVEFVYQDVTPLEQEVGVESLDFEGWERRSGVKRQASSSGVSLPGHSDRKELLGRIGCEKQVD